MNYNLKLQGLHCPSCKKLIEQSVGDIQGVCFVDVNLADQLAHIKTNRLLTQTEIEDALKGMDYRVVSLVEV